MIALTKVRALRALNMRRHGAKLTAIGREFGVSRERARQLVELGAEEEHRIHSADPWYELSPRTRNSLTGYGCEPTPAGVAAFLQVIDWKRIPYFGIKCHAELMAWLIRHENPAPANSAMVHAHP